MRQIGKIEGESEAVRFVAYLITQGIAAQAERDGGGWAIWVRDENRLDAARGALDEFRRAPEDARYQNVERVAATIQCEEIKRREQSQKNIVEVRGNWRRGSARKRPLTLTLIGACVVIGMMTNMGADHRNSVMRKLLFTDPVRFEELVNQRLQEAASAGSEGMDVMRSITWEDKTYEIRNGEVWRVFTPTLLHYGPFHLLFNMIMFYQFGTLIEHRRGSLRLGLMILAIGIASTLVQSLVPETWQGTPFAAGFSGVIFGLFGYVWMKSIYAPHLGMALNRNAKFILMLWLFLGISGLLKILLDLDIANWGHGIGFLSGVAIGYFPEIFGGSRPR